MQRSASARLSVLNGHFVQTETVPDVLVREDCAATQTILFGRPAYDGARFAKASNALHLSKDAKLPSQETAAFPVANHQAPAFGRPAVSTNSVERPSYKPQAGASHSPHDDLPAFSRPVASNSRNPPPQQPMWFSKVDATETPAGYQLDVVLVDAPGDVRVNVQGRQLCIAGLRFPPPRQQPGNILYSSELLGFPLVLTREADPSLFSAIWTVPEDSDTHCMRAGVSNGLLSVKIAKRLV